ncbi:MAG: glycosyltransferase [Cytophagales bacterium]
MKYRYKLAVIIVNYNVKYFLEQALLTVYKASEHIHTHIIVVDNNSVDGSVQMIEEKFPEITLIANKENVGFSKANNQGILIADSEYILLLNPDTVVQEDTFTKCIQFLDNTPTCGALGVKMIDGKGNFLPESKRGLPTPEVAFYKLFGFSKLFPKSKTFGKYHLSYLSENETHEVEVLSGAYMMMRQDALLKAGVLDETFFMYGEDVDLSYRIIQAGYKNYYFADTSIIHYKGESTKKSSIKYIFTFYQAMLIFAQKHFTSKQASLLSFIVNVGIYFKIGVELIKQRISLLFPYLLDFGLIWLIMIPISVYWGLHFKPEPVLFDNLFLKYILPIQSLMWVTITFFSGGYDKPFAHIKILRGVFFATIFISAISNFISEIRYSRGLIIVGAIVSYTLIVLTKFVLHYIRFKNLDINFKKPKNALLLGSYSECIRVNKIIQKTGASISVKGYLNDLDAHDSKMPFLGTYSQFNEVLNFYNIDEVLFCSKDIESRKIIKLMQKCLNPKIDFKIIPEQTDYIIGSNSSNSQGNIYTIDIVFNILKSELVRNKRVIDLVFSILTILFLPILVLFQNNKWCFIKNIFKVIWGTHSWVGISKQSKIKLPSIKDGIIIYPNGFNCSDEEKYHLEFEYAKNYSIYDDIAIILKNLSNLGGCLS